VKVRRFRRLRPVLTVFGLLLAAAPTFAHHGFAVEYDSTKCQEMTGTLTGVDWVNPHIYFYMDMKDADGKTVNWTFEAHSVPLMKRGGTERTDFTDNIGKVFTTRACPARSATKNKATAELLKFPDGKVRVVGQNVEGSGRAGNAAEN
jgi:hypothetical protein